MDVIDSLSSNQDSSVMPAAIQHTNEVLHWQIWVFSQTARQEIHLLAISCTS